MLMWDYHLGTTNGDIIIYCLFSVFTQHSLKHILAKKKKKKKNETPVAVFPFLFRIYSKPNKNWKKKKKKKNETQSIENVIFAIF